MISTNNQIRSRTIIIKHSRAQPRENTNTIAFATFSGRVRRRTTRGRRLPLSSKQARQIREKTFGEHDRKGACYRRQCSAEPVVNDQVLVPGFIARPVIAVAHRMNGAASAVESSQRPARRAVAQDRAGAMGGCRGRRRRRGGSGIGLAIAGEHVAQRRYWALPKRPFMPQRCWPPAFRW